MFTYIIHSSASNSTIDLVCLNHRVHIHCSRWYYIMASRILFDVPLVLTAYL
jgi:hypothetical protein